MSYKIIPGGDVTLPIGEGFKLIPHVCNDLGVMGAGVAFAIRKKWPKAYSLYREWYDNTFYEIREKKVFFELGQVQAVKVVGGIAIINMIAQCGINNKFNSNRVPIRYGALTSCMRKVCSIAKRHEATLHCPKFGSALAGGSWEVIESLIFELWVDIGLRVTIYDFDVIKSG